MDAFYDYHLLYMFDKESHIVNACLDVVGYWGWVWRAEASNKLQVTGYKL